MKAKYSHYGNDSITLSREEYNKLCEKLTNQAETIMNYEHQLKRIIEILKTESEATPQVIFKCIENEIQLYKRNKED